MKWILGLVFSLMSCGAMAVDTLPIGNPQTNGATKFFYNDNGTVKEVLKIDSNGLSGAGYSAKNLLINGNFDLWQRGTGISGGSGGVYVADQWWLYASTGSPTVTRVTYNDELGTYAASINPSADTSVILGQPLETVNTLMLRGKTVTFSIYMRKVSGYLNNPQLIIRTQTGAENRFGNTAGLIDTTATISNASILVAAFTRFSVTATIPTNATQIVARLITTNGSAMAQPLEVRAAMLNEGSVAAPFQLAGGNVGGEIVKAQRYFSKSCPVTAGVKVAEGGCSNGAYVVQLGFNKAINTYNYVSIPLPVEMRGTPVVTTYDGASATNKVTIFTSGSGASSDGQDYYSKSASSSQITVAGYTLAYYGCTFTWTADAAL